MQEQENPRKKTKVISLKVSKNYYRKMLRCKQLLGFSVSKILRTAFKEYYLRKMRSLRYSNEEYRGQGDLLY